MKSLRVKLILVVVAIALAGLLSVVISSLSIVREASREQIRTVNRQLSEIVSKTVVSQVREYRRDMEVLFKSWSQKPELTVDSEVFPDFLWLTFIDVTDKKVFEWSKTEKLAEMGIQVDELIGFKNAEKFSEELRTRAHESEAWMVFNSTVKTLFPTFILGTTFQSPVIEGRRFVAVAEISSEKLFSSVQGRKGQELILVDSHENILLSTKDGWDAGDLTYSDQSVLEILKKMSDGESRFSLLEYPNREAQLTSTFRFNEAGGLTLVLQEPVSVLKKTEGTVQSQSLLITFIVLIVMINLLIFFAGSFISPLVELTGLLERVGKGEFSGKLKSKSKDEIGRLTNVFNKMLSDLKAREEEVEKAKSKLVQSEKMSAFGQMSAGIAHEVKNPLAGILGYAQMSKKKLPADSEVLPYLDIIEKETVRCKEIVDNLMRFARQEKAVMSRMDINKTIKDSIRLVEHQMSISGIKLVQIFALDGQPVWMSGNPNQLQQVMMNLMLNAQQAMENKGTLTITTHYEPEQKRVIILVSDTGPGMPAEVKARIFEPFYTTKGTGKGTGLGLSVSLGIIKDHSGTIEVDSEPGKGTTFQITLPTENEQSSGDQQAKVA